MQPSIISTLQNRFHSIPNRHPDISWDDVREKIEGKKHIIDAIDWMEETCGEPDIIVNPKSGEIAIFDCSAESPAGRRSLCYDDEALEKRKKNKPAGSAVGIASLHGIELLSEEDYYLLQSFGDFDLKTSSWLATPVDVRSKGGAIFGDMRFGRVFIYHNGADSYYAARGFRCKVNL